MATLIRGTRIEITQQLSSEAAHIFANWIGCYSVIWNCKVAENKKLYEEYLYAQALGQDTQKPKPTQAYAHHITSERKYLHNVPSQIRRNAASKCHEAFTAALKKVRKMPRFKSFFDSKRNCLVTNELFDITLSNEAIEFNFKKTNTSKSFCHVVLDRKKEMTELPNMLWLTRENNRYFLSYAYAKESPDVRDEKTILDHLRQAPEAYQQRAVVGIDLGVDKPVALSTGQFFDFTDEEKKSLEKKHARRLKYQKKFSRQQQMAKKAKTKIGENARKTKAKLADTSASMAHIRSNMAHRVSKTIAEAALEVVVCEDLNIPNMTKGVQPKQDPETQKFLRNGARAKAGLNKAILNVGWGRILNLTAYKLRERDKILIKIDPCYSSQECHECGHIDADNRPTQKTFCCTRCRHEDNADHNAALVLKKRFLIRLNTHTFVRPTKAVTKIAVRRQKAARTADPVCGANIRPPTGSGVEAETSRSNPENYLEIDKALEGILEARPLEG